MEQNKSKQEPESGALSDSVSLLADCKWRMNKAKSKSENAYWMNRPWRTVEECMEEYADRKHEYETALSANAPHEPTRK